MFENLFFEPIANGGEFDKGRGVEGSRESGAQFFKPGGDGARFLDALEEVLHVMALFVKTFVILRRATFVGLGGNACLESERLRQLPERSAAVGFVSEDRSGIVSNDQIRGRDAVVTVSRPENDADRTPAGINQGVDFCIGSSFGSADALDFNALRAAKGVLVNLRAGRIDCPELANGGARKRVEDSVPDAGLAPRLPSRVDRGVWGEDAQRSPRAAFAQPEKYGEKNPLGIDRRPPALGIAEALGCTREGLINFFSRLALAASFG